MAEAIVSIGIKEAMEQLQEGDAAYCKEQLRQSLSGEMLLVVGKRSHCKKGDKLELITTQPTERRIELAFINWRSSLTEAVIWRLTMDPVAEAHDRECETDC